MQKKEYKEMAEKSQRRIIAYGLRILRIVASEALQIAEENALIELMVKDSAQTHEKGEMIQKK